MPAKHRRKCTLAGVAAIESDIRNPLTIRQPLDCKQQSRLLAPLRERHAGLPDKPPVHRLGRYVQSLGPVSRRRRIGGIRSNFFADRFNERINRQGEMQC